MYKRLVALAVPAFALVVAGCSGASRPSPPQGGADFRAGGAPPPSRSGGASLFTLPMVDGQPVSVRGPAVLFIFTTWCGYCKQVLPEVSAMAPQAAARGFRVYGVDVGEPVSKIAGFVQQYRPSFPVLVDQSGQVARHYGVAGYPTFIVVDADGRVRFNAHELPRNLLR